MKLWSKRSVLGAILIGAVGAGLWLALDAEARSGARALVERGLVALNLADPSSSGEIFWCPMHPEIRKSGQGICPICNMALVVLKGVGNQEPGVLRLSTRQIQQAGVRLAEARKRDLVREIDATGHIALDERRMATISSWISGRSRIERLHVNFQGDVVEIGQPLVELYSATLVSGIEEFTLAIKARDELKKEGTTLAIESAGNLVQSAKKRLIRLGLRQEQIDEFGREGLAGEGVPTVAIKSPLSGTVLRKLVEEGVYVKEGDPLLCIADLERLWLFIDIYEHELPLIELDRPVEFTTRAAPGRSFEGTVSFIDPVVQEMTRTVRVRCDVQNHEGLLKPGMFVRARVRSPIPETLSVPESSVLQSGRRSVVIIAEGGGRFRPRIVRLGRSFLYPSRVESRRPVSRPTSRSASRPASRPITEPVFDPESERFHEVLSGLTGDEKVVTAGNFLLNAEAQFQGLLKKMIEVDELAKRGKALPNKARETLELVLQRTLSISEALVREDASSIPTHASAIARAIGELRAAEDLNALGLEKTANGLLEASNDLAGPDGKHPQTARKPFAELSRHLIAYVRDFTPDKVSSGQLRVFECSMAESFGFQLWLQREPKIANPYMGKSMPG